MKVKKYLSLVLVLLVVLSATMVNTFAATTYSHPSELVAALAGKTVDEIVLEHHNSGKTYATIANDYGKLEEFKKEITAIKEKQLNDAVERGTLSRTEADELLKLINERHEAMDGTEYRTGGYGAGYGLGYGHNNRGYCNGRGYYSGAGLGNSRGTGYCRNYR